MPITCLDLLVRALLPVAFVLIPRTALAQTIGIHLVTLHLPQRDYLTGVNPGVYFKAANGATVGLYRNSLGTMSPYAGYTADFGAASVTGGVVYGYQRREKDCKQVFVGTTPHPARLCDSSPGAKTAAAPLLTPSLRLPQVWGVSPRLTLAPAWLAGDSTALHLSVEWRL
ncbi:MAG TPA: hypothetical protein VGM74_01185 [Burkholderiaceae bacterium]|jgi:hypothetical protein